MLSWNSGRKKENCCQFVPQVHITDPNKCWNDVGRKRKRWDPIRSNPIKKFSQNQGGKKVGSLRLLHPSLATMNHRQYCHHHLMPWSQYCHKFFVTVTNVIKIMSSSALSSKFCDSCLCNTRVHHRADFSVCVRAQTSIRKGEEVSLGNKERQLEDRGSENICRSFS